MTHIPVDPSMPPPSPAGIDAYTVNAAAFGGFFDFYQTFADGQDQSEVPPPLMIRFINHGVVYEVPPDPVFVAPADETFAVSPEFA